MSKLICHDCGINCDLSEVDGFSRDGNGTVILCSQCIERREEDEEIAEAMDYLESLRDRGFAIVVFTPEELGEADIEKVELVMKHQGQLRIDRENKCI